MNIVTDRHESSRQITLQFENGDEASAYYNDSTGKFDAEYTDGGGWTLDAPNSFHNIETAELWAMAYAQQFSPNWEEELEAEAELQNHLAELAGATKFDTKERIRISQQVRALNAKRDTNPPSEFEAGFGDAESWEQYNLEAQVRHEAMSLEWCINRYLYDKDATKLAKAIRESARNLERFDRVEP